MAQIPSNMDMNININIFRGRSAHTSRTSLRSSSISSSTLSIPYHQHIELNNDLPNTVSQKPIDSSQLSYTEEVEVGNLVRLATDKNSASDSQCVCNKIPTLKKKPQPYSKGKDKTINGTSFSPSENVVNTQLPYNINQGTVPDTWDGNFHSVSLHGSMEYLTLDAKNIKESLCCMMKYILNKKVESSKVNDVNDLKGIGKAAWGFISSLYKSGWDELIADSNVHSFRYKVKAQFTPKINEGSNIKKGKDSNANKLASISKLSSPILVKLPKEVNKISKYFKKNIEKKDQKKSYPQASSSSANIIRETLKIKEAFSNLQNKKIENIQKIIRGEDKPKPKFNMTTKRLSKKQIIVPMNINNRMQFIKESSAHITNINRALKNIKSEVVADFAQLENSGIVITTNKVVVSLDLQTIE